MLEKNNVNVKGHITVTDKTTGEVLIDKDNRINFENMSMAIARSLANKANGPIFTMAFGNGGSSIDALGVLTYLEPNVIGQNSTLYNETYEKNVDDNSVQNTSPQQNNMTVEHEDSKFYSDIIITCTLDYGEPSGQQAFDTSESLVTDYVFDELGLKTEDGLMISHVIFHPLQKSLNRIIEIIYTLRISMQ